MTDFTPWTALAGGLLIGGGATGLLATTGRIAGISGIFFDLARARGDRLWRLLFLAGMVAGAGVLFHQAPTLQFAPRTEFPLVTLVVAGLLVGFGTRLGNGCTSGHGVCGLGRRSVRSLAATLVFMLTGVVTTVVTRHWLGVAG